MSTKSREVVWGSRIMGAQISAQGAREVAHKSNQEADRPEAEAWSLRMEAMEGPRRRHRRSDSASTADYAGSRWSAIAARPGGNCRHIVEYRDDKAALLSFASTTPETPDGLSLGRFLP